MKCLFYTLCWSLLLFACSSPTESIIDRNKVTEAPRRTIPMPQAQRVTFYDAQQQLVTPEQFNQLLSDGLYFSEQRLAQDGSEEIHLISLKDHSTAFEGKALPDFQVTDLMGKEHSRTTLLGKVTVISFWSTESQWCIGEMNRLNELAQAYAQHQTVQWIAPSLNPSLEVSHFLQDFSWSYSFIADQRSLAEQLGVLTLPTHLVVNQNGIVVKAIVRDSASPVALQKTVERLL